jgi:hypothetical protein
MTGGLGFTKNMQISYKENRDLLKHKKLKNVVHSGEKTKLVFKKSDEKSLNELREKLKREKTTELIKLIAVFSLIVIITMTLLFLS